jgi:purine-nucleoside phosphorylase
MTPHINAEPGDYAETVLLPGDPLRAKHIAETFLSDVKLVNSARNCLGYTGYYNNKRISVQASGMGQPSMGIYVHELCNVYGVENIIRVGTCGSLQPNIHIGDCVVALSAATDSRVTESLTPRFTLSPCCDYSLLSSFMEQAKDITVHVGQITSNDAYYQEDDNWWKVLGNYGVLAVDMETHLLYNITSKFKKKALTVNMVSDTLCNSTSLSITEKETGMDNIIRMVLNSV